MIYAIGLDSDRTFCHFVSEVTQRGIQVQAINLRAVVLEGDWHFTLPDDGSSYISVGEEKFPLDPNGAYYCRIIDLSSVQSDLSLAIRWRGLMVALTAWLEHIPGTVIHRPGDRSDNFSKPLHEYCLQSAGFQVPASITSSHADKLAAFAAKSPTIVKTTSGVRADSRLVQPEEFLDFHPSQGPVHLQRYVAGADIRAHVVGNSVHAELIQCSEVDYRQSFEDADYVAFQLPESLCQQIIAATAAFGLQFAGWDFKVTDDHQFWCLEVNPMPGYDGYDKRANGRITDSLLAMLMKSDAAENSARVFSVQPKIQPQEIFAEEILIEEILTTEQCEKVWYTIYELKQLWIQRGKSNFFTLGAASYLDFSELADINDDYYSRAKKYNPILQQNFGWLYQLIQEALERNLQSPIKYTENLDIPGFHIWQYPAIFTQPTASIHFDLQYQNHKWQDVNEVDFSRSISFTLPIKLPRCGGGLNVWNLKYEEFVEAYNQGLVVQVEEMLSSRKQTFHPYKVGNLVIHSGHSLHQIAPVEQVYVDDERITLQGHGIYCDGEWQLYW
ncbi:RimK family alpha-L-glutamate ligase [Calothrix sp. PCC 7507]|uniref:ATP-grasp domain-containing protein n=1 Tax=Calothrix sp. PCC 7507 TaxID=99598 RepID=UPI00029F0E57|nr:hypothetical protein [Calothrix sp. PCC 7507]AFY31478.1 hypothetical protein Cal7507_1000 [Calothrix sp. PCC 7507]